MNNLSDVCNICGEGSLHARKIKNSVEHNHQRGEVDLHFSLCDVCGSEQSNAAQLRDNKRAMMAFRKRVDGLLTGKEVRTLREKLCLSQSEAALVFGGGPVAFSKYESDDVAQSEAMDKLLRLSLSLPVAFDVLTRIADVNRVLAWKDEWHPAEGLIAGHRRVTGAECPVFRVVSSSSLSADGKAKYAA